MPFNNPYTGHAVQGGQRDLDETAHHLHHGDNLYGALRLLSGERQSRVRISLGFGSNSIETEI
jgi:hypothetical protein